MYNELSEREFKILLRKVESQIRRTEAGQSQIKKEGEVDTPDIFETFTNYFSGLLHKKDDPILSRFMRTRARLVTADKALNGLIIFECVDFIAGRKEFKEIKELYTGFRENARAEHTKFFETDRELFLTFDCRLTDKSLLKTQELIIEDLFQKEIISAKLYSKFMEEIEEKIYS